MRSILIIKQENILWKMGKFMQIKTYREYIKEKNKLKACRHRKKAS